MTKYHNGKKVSPLPNAFALLICIAMFGAILWAATQGGTHEPEPTTHCVAGTYLQPDNTCLPSNSTRSK